VFFSLNIFFYYLAKTEAVLFSKIQTEQLKFTINGEQFKTGLEMKVLGTVFDAKLTWTSQVNSVISKAKKLNSALSFIRKKLTLKQFLKVLTSQFYSVCFYASAAWLHGQNSYKDLRKLNAIYYRSLRIAMQDYRRKMSRSKLDELGRMRSTAWSRFQSTSIALKAVTRRYPVRLADTLIANTYAERRKPKRLKFFNKADHKIGNQAIQNRCGTTINELGFDWLDGFSDDGWRIQLKKHFGIPT